MTTSKISSLLSSDSVCVVDFDHIFKWRYGGDKIYYIYKSKHEVDRYIVESPKYSVHISFNIDSNVVNYLYEHNNQLDNNPNTPHNILGGMMFPMYKQQLHDLIRLKDELHNN